jgi:hypothetical protein
MMMKVKDKVQQALARTRIYNAMRIQTLYLWKDNPSGQCLQIRATITKQKIESTSQKERCISIPYKVSRTQQRDH